LTEAAERTASADLHRLRREHESRRQAVKIDPRRVLVGLAMAGSLVIFPPAVGYAVGNTTSIGTRAVEPGSATDVLGRHHHDNDNSDNSSAALPSPPAPPAIGAPLPPPPLPPPPGAFAPAAAPASNSGPSADEINNNSNISPNND